MIVELLCRYQKDPSSDDIKTIEAQLQVDKLIQSDDFDYDKEKSKLVTELKAYEYGPMTINLMDVCTSNAVDAEHTCLRLYNNQSYTFKIGFPQYKAVYTTLMGRLINDFTHVEEIKIDNG